MTLPNIKIKTPKTEDEFNAVIAVARAKGYEWEFSEGTSFLDHKNSQLIVFTTTGFIASRLESFGKNFKEKTLNEFLFEDAPEWADSISKHKHGGYYWFNRKRDYQPIGKNDSYKGNVNLSFVDKYKIIATRTTEKAKSWEPEIGEKVDYSDDDNFQELTGIVVFVNDDYKECVIDNGESIVVRELTRIKPYELSEEYKLAELIKEVVRLGRDTLTENPELKMAKVIIDAWYKL